MLYQPFLRDIVDGEIGMAIETKLSVTLGQRSVAGVKPENQDSIAIMCPDNYQLTTKGITVAIADGVSSAAFAKQASEIAVRTFIADYYSTPDSWDVKNSSQKVLTALNRWLYSQSYAELHEVRGYLTTLSILIVKSCTAHIFHIGDSRIYRVRQGRVEQLTRDHQHFINRSTCYLTRAMGMDVGIDIDYHSHEVQKGDYFVTATDGFYSFVDMQQIAAALPQQADLEGYAEQLVAQAVQNQSDDNISVQILRIDYLPQENATDIYQQLTNLPFPPLLSVGNKLDGYRVDKELHASERSQLYLVTEVETGRQLVMKTPSVNYDDDAAYIERFMLEPWLGSRIQSPHVVSVVNQEKSKSCLYYLTEYIEGVTLSQWIQRNPNADIQQVIQLVTQLLKGLRAFQRKQIVHQDIKPDNVLIDANGVVKIIDFGACFIPSIREVKLPFNRDVVLGTARYSAPEHKLGEQGAIQSDLFSVGCILYEMLSGGKHPYSEAYQDANIASKLQQLQYTSLTHYNNLVPSWLDATLCKAVALDIQQRYQSLSEFITDLSVPNPALPMVTENQVFDWRQKYRKLQWLTAFLVFTQLISLLLLIK